MDVKSLQQICAERAVAYLKKHGIVYPTYDPKLSRQANYMAMVEYRIKESALTIEYLSAHNTSNVTNINQFKKVLQPVKSWGTAYNDK